MLVNKHTLYKINRWRKKERSLYNVLYSLYNIKYMKIPELIDLINEFVFKKI